MTPANKPFNLYYLSCTQSLAWKKHPSIPGYKSTHTFRVICTVTAVQIRRLYVHSYYSILVCTCMYPRSSRSLTTSWCPLRAASISAVHSLSPLRLISDGAPDSSAVTVARSPLAEESRNFSTISSFALIWRLIVLRGCVTVFTLRYTQRCNHPTSGLQQRSLILPSCIGRYYGSDTFLILLKVWCHWKNNIDTYCLGSVNI